MAGQLYVVPNLNIAPYTPSSYQYDDSAQAIEANGLNMGLYETTDRVERYYLYTNLNECNVAAYWVDNNLYAVCDKLAGRMVIESRGQYKYVSGQPLIQITDSYGTYYKTQYGLGTNSLVDVYDSLALALEALGIYEPLYPITYSYTNSTVSGQSEAAIGETVVVSAVPDVDYGITDASTQIIVTNNDVAVPYTWDAVNKRITFTMPDPT